MSFFGDVNVSINKNLDILKFTFTLNMLYLRFKSVIISIFYCILLFSICFLQKIWICTVLNGDVAKGLIIMSRDCTSLTENGVFSDCNISHCLN